MRKVRDKRETKQKKCNLLQITTIMRLMDINTEINERRSNVRVINKQYYILFRSCQNMCEIYTLSKNFHRLSCIMI